MDTRLTIVTQVLTQELPTKQDKKTTACSFSKRFGLRSFCFSGHSASMQSKHDDALLQVMLSNCSLSCSQKTWRMLEGEGSWQISQSTDVHCLSVNCHSNKSECPSKKTRACWKVTNIYIEEIISC